jgi:hypothetical protein
MLQQYSSEGLPPGAASKEHAQIVAHIYAVERKQHDDIGKSYRQFEQCGREEVGESVATDRAWLLVESLLINKMYGLTWKTLQKSKEHVATQPAGVQPILTVIVLLFMTCAAVVLRRKLASENRYWWFTMFWQVALFTIGVSGLTFVISYLVSYYAGRRIYLSQHCPAQ